MTKIDELAYNSMERFMKGILRLKIFESRRICELPSDYSWIKTVSEKEIRDRIEQIRSRRDSGKTFDFHGTNPAEWFHRMRQMVNEMSMVTINAVYNMECRKNDEA